MRNVTVAACAVLAFILTTGAYAQSPKSPGCTHKELAETGGGNGGTSAKLAEEGGGNGRGPSLAETGGGNGGTATQVAMAPPCP
jgi:hypothetical protein